MDAAIEFKSVVALLTAAVEAATAAQSAITDYAAAQTQATADLRARIEALEAAVGDTSELPPITRPQARAA